MMKPIPFFTALALVALACTLSPSQNALFTPVTFPVCEVKKAEQALGEVPYREAVEKAIALETRRLEKIEKLLPPDSVQGVYFYPDSLLAMPRFKHNTVELWAFGEKNYQLVPTNSNHPLMAAMYRAYAEHRPLTLSPDMVWLLIAQGFSEHVELNAEALRSRLVGFDGKKVLMVKRDHLDKNNPDYWRGIFPEFAEQIGHYTGKELSEAMLPRFSTTGIEETAAFQVSLMDAMSPFFLYAMQVACGIPEITLEGRPEDWAALEARAAALSQYDLAWWTDELAPILHDFTEASKGNARREFWQEIFRINHVFEGCTSISHLDGWMLRFFPYVNGKKNAWVTNREAVQKYTAAVTKSETALAEFERNNKPGTKKRDEKYQEFMNENAVPSPIAFGLPIIELSDLPSGLAKADVLLDNLGEKSMLEFQAGFVGIRQDMATLGLRPEINWLVLSTGEKPKQEDLELYEKARKFLESAGK